jgi:vitamin B12 transporter
MKTTIKLSMIASLLLVNSINAEEVLGPILVVSANKTEQSIENTTSNVSVITAEDIEENGYQTVAEALSHVAGITFSQSGGMGTQTSLFMRGMKTEKILVLLDGVTLNNPSSTDGQAFFEHISLDDVEQIEVIKGGTSSIWGADASAGVINIITKKAKEGVHGNIGIMYGSYDTKKVTSSFSYKKDGFDALVNLSKIDTEGFSAKAPRSAEDDAYKNTSALLKLGYDLNENNRVTLIYNDIDANTEYDGSYSTLGAEDPVANIDMQQQDLALNYFYTSDSYTSHLKLAQSKSKRLDTSDSAFGDAFVKYNAEQKVLSWINSYQLGRTNLVVGMELHKTQGYYQFNTYTPIENSFHDKAMFLSVNHELSGLTGGKTILEGSIRKDFFDAFEDKVSYKAGLKHFHENIDGLTSSMNFYKSTDAPNSYQVANVVFGETLTPDTTNGYDITLQYKDISVTYFSNVIDNKIAYDFSSWGYINNTGKEKMKGIEVQGSYSFDNANIMISTNYTHLFKYVDESGLNLDKRAKDTLNVNVDKYLSNNSHIGINMQYIGDREEFGQSTGNYSLWNFNYSRELSDSMKLSINVKNLFDKEYQSVYGYASEGRSAYARVTYSF